MTKFERNPKGEVRTFWLCKFELSFEIISFVPRIFGEGFRQERFFTFWKRQRLRNRAGGWRHFAPGLLKDMDHFVLRGFVREFGKLVFEENQAEGVLQALGLGIGCEILFEVEGLDSRDEIGVVTAFAQDLARFFGVEVFEGFAPLEIAGAGHGIGIARNHPATKMLRPGSQAQGFRGIRAQFEDTIGEPLGVGEFSRDGFLLGDDHVGVARVFLVEPLKSGLKSAAHS